MAKISKIRELALEELEREVENLSDQLFRLRFQKATGQLENALKIQHVRRDLARVKTVLTQRRREPSH